LCAASGSCSSRPIETDFRRELYERLCLRDAGDLIRCLLIRPPFEALAEGGRYGRREHGEHDVELLSLAMFQCDLGEGNRNARVFGVGQPGSGFDQLRDYVDRLERVPLSHQAGKSRTDGIVRPAPPQHPERIVQSSRADREISRIANARA
jgi:hypothetical protein